MRSLAAQNARTSSLPKRRAIVSTGRARAGSTVPGGVRSTRRDPAPVRENRESRPGAGTWWAIPLLGIVVVSLYRSDIEASFNLSAFVLTASCLVAIFLTGLYRKDRPFSVASTFFVLVTLFHTGVVASLMLGRDHETLPPSVKSWIDSEAVPIAAYYTTIAVLVSLLTYLVVSSIRESYLDSQATGRERWAESSRRRRERLKDARVPAPHTGGARTVAQRVDAALGPTLLVLGIALWFWIAYNSGVSIFGGSYLEWLDATIDSNTPLAYLLMGLGFPYVAASPSKWQRRLALALFVIWATPAFLLGLRGEVLIPLAAGVVVSARRRRLKVRWWTIALVVLGVMLGSAVAARRVIGIAAGGLQLQDFNPLNGFTELGASLRPVVMSVQWHDLALEPAVGWDTYANPILRLVGTFTGLLLAPPAINDPSVFSIIVSQRIGPIGGSPVAEAIRANGMLGVCAVFVAIGFALALLDALPASRGIDSLVGMLSFALFLWVRNDFIPLPLEVCAAFAVFLVGGMLRAPGVRGPRFARANSG